VERPVEAVALSSAWRGVDSGPPAFCTLAALDTAAVGETESGFLGESRLGGADGGVRVAVRALTATPKGVGVWVAGEAESGLGDVTALAAGERPGQAPAVADHARRGPPAKPGARSPDQWSPPASRPQCPRPRP